jgi:ATP-dependent helicase/nuclease subunit A
VSKTVGSDEAARRLALDPAQSFIVQAPAGAGKTELLTQRFLMLLATVDRPEEVLAITFTKKATAEMRARVLDALARAAQDNAPQVPHEYRTWELARRVRERDIKLAWHIERNPGRLGIQTIDSFCLGLVRQMPLLARFGAPPAIIDDASDLYRVAAHATLALLNDQDSRASSIEHLLRHLDNDARRAAGLIADMLARRDQWLRRVGDRNRLRRETLEAALANVVRDALVQLCDVVPRELAQEIAYNVAAAADNLRENGVESGILACHDLKSLPNRGVIEQRALWLGVAELLLTDKGAWRKSVTKNQGFPARSEAKNRMMLLLERLGDHAEFARRLHELRMLPPVRYDDAQWHVLQALVEVLPLAAAQLKLVFAEQGGVDFTEVAQGALAALGEPDAPTDLLLALDYRLRHILVDEFQDTSVSQFELLERLTAGWAPGDGRTLFLVGDPMQSIYRFREADVGLYLRAVHAGIGTVPLTRLALSANFRSQQGIVEWVNRSFEKIFPTTEDIGAGAVPYAPLEAAKPRLADEPVTTHSFFGKDSAKEAETVVGLVRNARTYDAHGSIAILVRSREHLAAIVPALKQAELSFRAIEIERLAERQIVQDLLALTCALLHTADRPAWFAMLRAPYCGLTLADLHALADDASGKTIWELMQDDVRVQHLSVDGQRRLCQVRDVLTVAIASRGRVGLRRYVEGTWLALGGPACVVAENSLSDVDVFFGLLEGLDSGSVDMAAVANQAVRLFAAPDAAADDRLQIMTIHKAKGLEFDTVIVPGLGRKQRVERIALLQWTERARGEGEPDLLLAPVHAAGADGDAISSYLRKLEETRARHEDTRLLYVAVTRAKRQLHLLGHVDVTDRDGEPMLCEPASGSLLRALWPVVQQQYGEAFERSVTEERPSSRPDVDWDAVQDQQRLASGWQRPQPPSAVAVELQEPTVVVDDAIEFVWAGETARHVGTVVHRWLLRIGGDGLANWNAERIAEQESAFRNALSRLGVPVEELDAAVKRVATALASVFGDERAHWLFGPQQESRSEYGLSGVLDKRVVSVVLDRTFVDNDGTRWIVDYKTSGHEGGGVDAFLDSERDRYAGQLNRYARLLSLKERRPVKLGLYFPLLRGWREWPYEGT